MKKRTGWILVVILGIILVALCLEIEKTKREQEEKKIVAISLQNTRKKQKRLSKK